ncbi:aminotransferase class IV [Gracilimonas mengyeensis]|uniref:Branched-chain amino acid aminotransferase n=1 Tax=Gracilimonas mengyeensis TaxID=1302730 RepID=A0A521DW10_9BACT|nr:aminotransferase class IV [Gracilimonas mengyeensis]SMO75934.1 branched-chain amino acid aminotransferase [Gracilimonas mengyeensis]
MKKSPKIILNGELIAESEAKVSPLNRGMMYGDGCFETLRAYAGQFLRWEAHYARLEAGMNYLGMNLPFDSAGLKSKISELLRENQLFVSDAMVRLQCWREGGRGYAPDSRQSSWMVQVSEANKMYPPSKLITAKTRCIPSEALERRYKLSNGLNYIKATQEAQQVEADDALMLTMQDKISETTSANIFWVKDGTLFTPDVSCDLLPGVTRKMVLDVAEKLGIPLETGAFGLMSVQNAEAMFCTNSLVEIREVSSLDGIEFTPQHMMVKEIKAGFEQLKEEELQA